jgi:hypothetical protein
MGVGPIIMLFQFGESKKRKRFSMESKNIFIVHTILILFLLLVACSAPKPTPTQPAPTQTQTVEPLPDTSIRYHFVTNKLLVPTTQEQAQVFALNIDEDPQQHPDNLFGELLTMLLSASPALELQPTVDQAVDAGQIITLHLLQVDDPVNDSSAMWSIFQGQKTLSAPSFNGTDRFTLDPVAPTNSLVAGSLTNGHFTGGPGTARAQIALMGMLVEVDLIGVRLEADVSAQGCANGKLGGGVTVDEFNAKLLPSLADGLTQVVKADITGASALAQLFDLDRNAVITVQELKNNLLLKIAISPDLDLLDASGKFNPRQDGVKDSLSVGLGFTCVPATFAAPGD